MVWKFHVLERRAEEHSKCYTRAGDDKKIHHLAVSRIHDDAFPVATSPRRGRLVADLSGFQRDCDVKEITSVRNVFVLHAVI
jgi:hypothetical protein